MTLDKAAHDPGKRGWSTFVKGAAYRGFVRMLDDMIAGGNTKHPKIARLEELLLDHFRRWEERARLGDERAKGGTRVIIFTGYRASVAEICTHLEAHRPTINAKAFVGQASSGVAKKKSGGSGKNAEAMLREEQFLEAEEKAAAAAEGRAGAGAGADDAHTNGKEMKTKATKKKRGSTPQRGQTQKEQKAVIAAFRRGDYNTLVATSIAEEGLDIGSVDLIISYEALVSPVRMVQRFGRTGRKRMGRVVVLVMEGAEQQKLKTSRQRSRSILNKLRNSTAFRYYTDKSLMFPAEPQMETRELAIEEYRASQVGGTAQPRKRKLKVGAAKAPRKRKGASQRAWLADVDADVDAGGVRRGGVGAAAGGTVREGAPGCTMRGVLRGSWPKLTPFLSGRNVMRNAVPTATHAIAHTARSQLFTNLLSFATASGWDSPAFLAREARDAAQRHAWGGAAGTEATAERGAEVVAARGASHATRVRSPPRADEMIDESASESDGGRASGGAMASEMSIDAEEEGAAAQAEALDFDSGRELESSVTRRRPSRRANGASAACGASEEQRRTPLAVDFAQMSVCVPLSPQRHAPQRKRGARCCMLARQHLGPCIHGDVERENISPVKDVGRGWMRASRGVQSQRARLPLPPRAVAPASTDKREGLALGGSPVLATKTRFCASLRRDAPVDSAVGSSPALREISLSAAAAVPRASIATAGW